MFPAAMNPIECMTGHGQTSGVPVWITFVLCVLVIVQYSRIAHRWFSAFSHSKIATSLIGIFLLCALCGYGAFCVSMLDPNAAYTARLFGLFVLVVFNELFLAFSRRKRFEVEAYQQKIRERFVEHIKRGEDVAGLVLEIQEHHEILRDTAKELRNC